MTQHTMFEDLSHEQTVAKIVHEIRKHEGAQGSQPKLSLLQDLLITLLSPTADKETRAKLHSVQCHACSEDVVRWLDGMADVYASDPRVQRVAATLTPEQLAAPY